MPGQRKPKHQLVDVKLTEISLVDRPANQGSEVVLFKRDESSEEDDMNPTEEQLQALTQAVAKAEEALASLTEANDELTAKNDELTGKIDELTGEITKRDEQLVALKKAQGNDGEDEIAKALKDAPEPVAKAMQALGDRLKLAESLLAKSADEKAQGEFIRKAATFDKLPTTAEKLGPVLMRVEKGATTKEDAAELERLLKAANEAIAKGGDGTQEIGKRGAGGANAMDKIEAEAAEIRKSDSGMTREMAITKALENKPELYDAYVKETRQAQ